MCLRVNPGIVGFTHGLGLFELRAVFVVVAAVVVVVPLFFPL